MEKLIGRYAEKEKLMEAFHSTQPELVAVYGRRRVGKKFLVESVFEKNIVFEFSGAYKTSMKEQLKNFARKLTEVTGSSLMLAPPVDWGDAFSQLQTWLSSRLTADKKVIFFDELPWLDTHKSNFLGAFSYFWNSWAVKQKHILIVICGSAASWMIRNIINSKGGLHNRITASIRLLPFNLHETESYLKSRRVNIDRYQVLQIYMAMGGIPHYLRNVKRGESAMQTINRNCFTKDGVLRDEFEKLYESLFDDANRHMTVIKELAKKGKGLTRNELITVCNISSGGTATKWLKELEESGFITSYIPFAKTAKDAIYKLTDEYSLFYLKYIEGSKATTANAWIQISGTPGFRSWSGLAFECICLKHVPQIKKALGIAGIYSAESAWRFAEKNKSGAQIDLLIDRADHSVNICEMKYSESEYVLSKSYAEEIRRKKDVFKKATGTKKTLFITMVTTFGVTQNIHSVGNIDNEITMDALFE